MKRKDMLRQLLAPGAVEDEAATAAPDRRVPSGAVRAMGLDLERLASGARRAEELERQAANGQSVVELDPALVDPSFAEDRIGRTMDAEFRRLVASIGASGQQVPILVRPHPAGAGRYQVAYGHRRLAAAGELGIPVRAIVRPLSDAELVVAQGKENAERRDLSFIERALFAAELEARDFDRPTLLAALAVHPAELSRYLSVARSVPRSLVHAIGPAPRAGRPRWMELASLLAAEGAQATAANVAEQPGFQAAPSDRRFELMMTALRQPALSPTTVATATLQSHDGTPAIRLETLAIGARFTVLEEAAPGLSAFLLARLPALLAEFGAGTAEPRGERAPG